MTTYTVYRADDCDDFTAGLSLRDAAHELLTADGYDYEIRQDEDGDACLWISDGSANTTRGARHMVRAAGVRGLTEDEIFASVVAFGSPWHGMFAAPDEIAAGQRADVARAMAEDEEGCPISDEAKNGVRAAREYSLDLRLDGAQECVTFIVPPGTESEQDAVAVSRAREIAENWAEDGDWGDDGAEVDVHYTLSDDDSEWEAERITVTIEPDEDAIARKAGVPDCDHEWTGEGMGGLKENPGVWSMGGTTIKIVERCSHCGWIRTRIDRGSQRTPGEMDTIKYEAPDAG